MHLYFKLLGFFCFVLFCFSVCSSRSYNYIAGWFRLNNQFLFFLFPNWSSVSVPAVSSSVILINRQKQIEIKYYFLSLALRSNIIIGVSNSTEMGVCWQHLTILPFFLNLLKMIDTSLVLFLLTLEKVGVLI